MPRKYVLARRLALFIEEGPCRGPQWAVFGPNDERLWCRIKSTVGSFMAMLIREGAFPALTPDEAYFVKCDRETMTQNDINKENINILIGFAPLKPAEFVIIRIRQISQLD